MPLECLTQITTNLACETAKRACLALELKEGQTYWVPLEKYKRNTSRCIGPDTFLISNVEIPERVDRRDVNVYIRAEIYQIRPSIDDNGKPVVLVHLKKPDILDYAIQECTGQLLSPGFHQITGYWEYLIYYSKLQLPGYLQRMLTAPYFVTTHRQLLTFIPQDVRVIYTFQRQS